MDKELVFEAMKDLPEEFKIDDLIRKVAMLIEEDEKEMKVDTETDKSQGTEISDKPNK